MINIEIVFEKGDAEWWGRIGSENEFSITTVADTQKEVTKTLADLLQDWINHEGQLNQTWKNVNVAKDVKFSFAYDLSELFQEFSVLKIGSVAKLAEINQSLLRQYVAGIKYPSEQQTKKIENAIKKLGERLVNVSVL
jgi:hypothetical protein